MTHVTYEASYSYAYAGDDPVNGSDPGGLMACPSGTNYSGSKDTSLWKFTCLTIQFTQLGKEIWIRQGSKRSFGLAHQSLPLEAVRSAIDNYLEEQGTARGGNTIFGAHFEAPTGKDIEHLYLYAGFSDTNGKWGPTPDRQQIGLTTTYCEDVVTHSVSKTCPSWVVQTLEAAWESFNTTEIPASSQNCDSGGGWVPGIPSSDIADLPSPADDTD
jgi:hypothetical protein